MNNPLIIALVVLAVILAGAFAGVKVRDRLPEHHLTDETRNLVSVSTAVVATVSALVLGLLISNANHIVYSGRRGNNQSVGANLAA
jgi:ABC-type transporter Mla maintaining outer membrane lipid asymmetry permease subunit MlaE